MFNMSHLSATHSLTHLSTYSLHTSTLCYVRLCVQILRSSGPSRAKHYQEPLLPTLVSYMPNPQSLSFVIDGPHLVLWSHCHYQHGPNPVALQSVQKFLSLTYGFPMMTPVFSLPLKYRTILFLSLSLSLSLTLPFFSLSLSSEPLFTYPVKSNLILLPKPPQPRIFSY